MSAEPRARQRPGPAETEAVPTRGLRRRAGGHGGGSAADAVLDLQRTAGNAAVAGLLLPAPALILQRACGCGGACCHAKAEEASDVAVQRWKVDPTLECHEVVDWLDSNSPYAPEWAATACELDFKGKNKIKHTTLDDGTTESRLLGHKKLKVTAKCPVDPPRWKPTKRPGRAAEVKAWAAMRKVLDGHEREHQRIGKTTAAEAQARWRAVDETFTGADSADTTGQATAWLQAEQEAWRADAQAQQDAIDPFRDAVLACP